MPGLTPSGRNTAAAALRAEISHVSLHSGDPGTTGANEIAPERKSVSLSEPSGGVMNVTNDPLVDVPANETVRYVGYWSALTGGDLVASSQVTEEAYGENGGQYRIQNASEVKVE